MSSPTELQLAVFIVALIGATAGTLNFLRGAYQDSLKNLVEQLKDPRDRANWIQLYSRDTPWKVRYSLTLLRLNVYISRVYSAPISWSAFDRSLVFTIIYPFTLYLLAWALGSSNKIGNLVFLGAQAHGWDRGIIVLAYVLLAATAAVLIRWIPKSDVLFVYGKSSTFLTYRSRDWLNLSLLLIGLFGTWYMSQVLTSVGYAVSFAVFFIYSGALYFAWRALLSRQPRAAPIVSGILVLGLAFTAFSIWWLGLGAGTVAFLILFFVLLPVVNALFDFASWVVTRWFLKLASAGTWSPGRIPVLTRGLLVDIAWAAFCLQALAAAILIIYVGYDFLFPAHAVGWREQLLSFHTASSTTALLLVGMLATTLIPTAIHLAVGLSGVAAAWLPQTDSIVELLSADAPSPRRLQQAATAIQWLRIGVYVAFPIVAVILCSVPWLVGPYIEGPVYRILKLIFLP